MVTDDERREVAERLRCAAEQGQPYTVPTLACFIGADCVDIWTRLADLIEPSESGQNRDRNQDSVQKESPIVQIEHECDREALLALAEEMCDAAWRGKASEGWTASVMLRIGRYARRIREACGEEVE